MLGGMQQKCEISQVLHHQIKQKTSPDLLQTKHERWCVHLVTLIKPLGWRWAHLRAVVDLKNKKTQTFPQTKIGHFCDRYKWAMVVTSPWNFQYSPYRTEHTPNISKAMAVRSEPLCEMLSCKIPHGSQFVFFLEWLHPVLYPLLQRNSVGMLCVQFHLCTCVHSSSSTGVPLASANFRSIIIIIIIGAFWSRDVNISVNGN